MNSFFRMSRKVSDGFGLQLTHSDNNKAIHHERLFLKRIGNNATRRTIVPTYGAAILVAAGLADKVRIIESHGFILAIPLIATNAVATWQYLIGETASVQSIATVTQVLATSWIVQQ